MHWSEDNEVSPYAKAMRRLMGERNISQAKLARLTGLSRTAIHAYFHGQADPSLKNLTLIAQALGVKASDIIASAEGGE